jgi:dihydrofolate reductase
MEEHMFHFLNNQVDTILLGRKAYQLMEGYWPASTESIAPAMNTLPKIVFSKTLDKTEWNNTRIIQENIEEEINSLKQAEGKDLVLFGGAAITSSLVELHLIDEYQIIINPVILGKGKPTFLLNKKINLQLTNSKRFICGNVIHYYHPRNGNA